MGNKLVEDEKIRKLRLQMEKLEKEKVELAEKMKQLKAGKDSYFLTVLVDNILCFQRRGKETGITKWNRVSEF